MSTPLDKMIEEIEAKKQQAAELTELPEIEYDVTDELARSTYFFLREMERYFLLDEDTGEYSSRSIASWAHDLAEQFPQGIKDFVEFEGE